MYGIFTYIWLICMANVGKYTSPMDPMGKDIFGFFRNKEMLKDIYDILITNSETWEVQVLWLLW